MRKYNLNIAGYNIGFEASPDGPELDPALRFLSFVRKVDSADVLIRVHAGSKKLPEKAERVFHAPYVEEIDGIQKLINPDFWSIWKYRSDLYIKTSFPQNDSEKSALLKFSLESHEWDLWIDTPEKKCDPFEYPMDGLILYYLTVIHGDIMIHASGVNNKGKGYLFSGISGKGKSTMAKIWDDSGAKVIHDDRLILRKSSVGYSMYNTPVYSNDIPSGSALNKIFIIAHGEENELQPVRGASAVSLIMSNCIQHNWDSEIIARLLGSVSIMCGTVPVVKLLFKPDQKVIDHILEHE